MDLLLPTVTALCIPVLLLWAVHLGFTVREQFLDYRDSKEIREYDGPPVAR